MPAFDPPLSVAEVKGIFDGRFVVIEYNKGKPIGFRRLFGHYVPKEVIIEEMDEVGFDLENDFDFLPEQHFCIFSRAEVSRSA